MAEERAQRRLAAILAADVVGYSRLMQLDEAGTLAALKARRKGVLQPAVARHRGRIVKVMGDGVLVEFASAVDAVECAVQLQQAMASANKDLTEDRCFLLRIGINLGDILVEGGDLYGDGVNVAARLEGLAEPGGIVVSGKIRAEVANKLAVGFEDLGEQKLKNMAEPVRAYRVSGTPAPETGTAPTAATQPSIAVLPFANMSGDPDQEYFSDGITEDIITELARYHSLRVIARNTSFQFRGPSVDIAAVRRALGVSYVVEGSVRKSGNRIRMTAQLIDAATQAHIWAERYDRDIEDIFAVQDELTRTVAATLVGRVTTSGAEQTRRKPTKDWVAYDYFLQGRECDYRYDIPGAATSFARAVELDPEYLQAHAWLAITLCLQYVVDERTETVDEAAAHAQKALMLDPNDAQAHDAMGYVALRRQKIDVAGEHFSRAVSLNPNDVTIAADQANWLLHVGRLEEALEILDTMLKRDPYSPTWIWEIRGATLYHLKRFDEAITALRHVSTENLVVLVYLAAATAQAGRLEDAHSALTNYFQLKPNMTLNEIAPKIQPVLRDHLLDGLRKAGMPE